MNNHNCVSDEWNLRISSPGLQDSGSYECQVFSTMKINTFQANKK